MSLISSLNNVQYVNQFVVEITIIFDRNESIVHSDLKDPII